MKLKQITFKKVESKTRLYTILICIGCILYYFAFLWLENAIINVNPVTESIISPVRVEKAKAAKAKELTIEDKICSVFGPQCTTAIAIAKAESNLNCSAQNINKDKSVDLGLFQINSVHLKKGWKAAELLDCDKSIQYAYEIFESQGFNPWVAYKTGKYKKYL